MTPQAEDFRAESDALHTLIAALTDEELKQKTGFKDWTIETIVRHLHVWNIAAELSLGDRQAFKSFFAQVMAHDGGSLPAFEIDYLDGLSGRPLVETWQDFYGPMADKFAAADPSERVEWAGPSMSVRSSITARLMETWAHSQAVYDALGVVRENDDQIRNIVVLGVNTFGWTFKNRNLQIPDQQPYLQLIAPSGATWEYGENNPHERIEGKAEEFCQVVTQVRNIADTNLRVIGHNAKAWMDIAQCFAGSPENPPPPGTRGIQSPA
jgi:uncharacterized protein (TIGR03084 family)